MPQAVCWAREVGIDDASDAAVLVVDDEELVRGAVQRALVAYGFDVVAAQNVGEARARIDERGFACALVDWGLPRECGLDVLVALQDRQPSCARVLMTSRSSGEVVRQAVNEGGVTSVLHKPFATLDMVRLVEQLVRRRDTPVGPPSAERASLHRALSEAIEAHLSIALQPIVDDTRVGPQRGRRIFALEALLRSTHPTLSTPGRLLEAAERLDRIPELAAHAVFLAAETLPRVAVDQNLFVNLHPRQLADPRRLARDLEPLRAEAHRVVLEVTERTPLDESALAVQSREVMRELGFRVALDDLGAGYASLGMLAELEPEFVKIDMSLIRDLHRSPRRQRLVQVIGKFAEAERARVIAEGIETVEELHAVRACDVSLVQGFLFGRSAAARG